MTLADPIWLASSSPRRRELLAEAGVRFEVAPPDIDDGALRPAGHQPAHWALSMAHLKARRVAEMLNQRGGAVTGTVLAADTVCAIDDRILGQPVDAADAARMLRLLRNAAHQTLTGVCILDRASRRRWLWADAARVFIGPLTDAQIDDYVASGKWRGKAGAYNLDERIAAGWPITCTGDPTTVTGLPMRRLRAWLEPGPTGGAVDNDKSSAKLAPSGRSRHR